MPSFKIKIAFLLALVSFVSSPAAAEITEINVVTTIKPLHSIVSNIMMGVAEPKLLMRSSLSPHDYKLKPSDIRELNHADVIFWIGPELESRLAKSIQRITKPTRVIQILQSKKINLLKVRHKNGDSQRFDPHVWLSIENARIMATIVSKTLSQFEPGNATIYSKNLQTYLRELTRLEQSLHRVTKAYSTKQVLSYHDAFQYFESEFGLQNIGVIVSSTEHRPGAKRVSNLRKLVKTKDIACIFNEPGSNPKILRSILKGSKVKIATLDSIGVELEPGLSLYTKLMQNISTSILRCLK
jgi:zinc transport system substrate-binding protein